MVEGEPAARVTPEIKLWQLSRRPSCAAARLSLLAVPCDALEKNAMPGEGTFDIVVCLLLLAVASGQLIFLDSAGASAGNESPFRNRDALAATAAAAVTAVAAAALLAAAARFY